MEARAILYKIRQRGLTIQAVGNVISLAPRQSANNLMIDFIREHKNKLLTALYQEQDELKKLHQDKKRALGHRLVVLRNYLKRIYWKSENWINDEEHLAELEELVDWALKSNEYDLEKAIDYFRVIAPAPKIIDGRRCKCGYMLPFCLCK